MSTGELYYFIEELFEHADLGNAKISPREPVMPKVVSALRAVELLIFQFGQRLALVGGDVVGFVAFYFVLRVVFVGVVSVAFVVEVFRVHLDDLAADAAGFGIPAYVVADLEFI